MGVTTTVNGLTVVHKKSGGVSIAFPDPCKTPTPAGTIPIPYPNVAKSKDTDKGTKTVKVDGKPIMHKKSNFKKSTGDEAGVSKGIVSNKTRGKAYPKMHSSDVKVEDKNTFRQTDLMMQNGGSNVNTPPTSELQTVKIVVPQEEDPPKVTSTSFSESTLKCGDEVKITIETENCEDGAAVTAIVNRESDDLNVAVLPKAVEGNKAEIDWITKTGPKPDERDDVKLGLEAWGAGEPATASSALTIEHPTYDIDLVRGSRTVAPVSLEELPFGIRWVQDLNAAPWGWDYGYDIEITGGKLLVTCRLSVSPQDGLTLGPRVKRLVEAMVESIWNGAFRFREHRVNCKRGRDCDCSGGCCLFPVVFQCELLPAGDGNAVHGIDLWPNSPCSYGRDAAGDHVRWWNSGNWFLRACPCAPGIAQGFAHEWGHSLGLYDEYYGGAVDYPRDASGTLTGVPPNPSDPDALMGSGLEIKERYLKEFHDWFLDKAGDDYKLERIT